MHGGTVEARSAGVGQGSEFIVRLPRQTESLPHEPPSVKPCPSVPRRILVVDDNRDSADSLSMLLELNGHELRTAYDGIEAVEAVAAFQPDIVLLDLGMPRLNGYEAARRIREQQGHKAPLLVALTGWGQDHDRRRTEEAGFDFHLIKPVELAALTKLLSESGGG